MESFEEKLTRKIHTTFLYACLKVSKAKSKINKRIGVSRVFQNKKEKNKTKRLSFIITQFKIEFLLPFTSRREVLEKMPNLFTFHFIQSFIFTNTNIFSSNIYLICSRILNFLY